ncbi:MAG: DUF4434 domain-containing protein [Pseudomonadota bacterium]
MTRLFCSALLCLLSAACFDFSSTPLPSPDSDVDGIDGDPAMDDWFAGDDGPAADGDDISGDLPADGADEGEGECIRRCEGRECGDDGCGGSCGPACDEPFYCSGDGLCVCVPRCDDAECGSPEGDGCGGTCSCLLDGSFVEPSYWYPDRGSFRAMLRSMRAFGMSTVVVRAVRAISCAGADCETSQILSMDEVGLVLDDIADAGMEAFLGLVECRPHVTGARWWENGTLPGVCAEATDTLVEDFVERYGTHGALAGFFLPSPIPAGIALEELQVVNESFYRPAVREVHDSFAGCPVAAAVYYVAENNESADAVSVSQLANWVGEFMSGGSIPSSSLDIMILEDGAGEYKNSQWSAPDPADYLGAALSAASPRIVWSGLELYQWSSSKTAGSGDNYFHPACMTRVRRQIDRSRDAVRRIAAHYPFHMAGNIDFLTYGDESAGLNRAYDALYFKHAWLEDPEYSFDREPNPSYEDNGGMLFNDRLGEESREDEWVGWLESPGTLTKIFVELGEDPVGITDVAVVLRSETDGSIHYPLSMNVYVSPDGSSFDPDPMGTLDIDCESDPDYGRIVARVFDPDGVDAIRLLIELEHASGWLMVSEIEVY